MTPIPPTQLDADALDDAPLTADRRRYADGVREIQEPRSRVRCQIVLGPICTALAGRQHD